MKMVRPPIHGIAVSGVLDRLYRRRMTILVTVGVCLALAVAVDLLLPQRFTSTATVTVVPLTDSPYGNGQPTQLVNMESERATVTSLAVGDLASRTLEPRPTPRQVQESLDVVIPPQSLVLRISATTGDPQRSAAWANAVAAAYLTDRTNTAREAVTRITSRLQSDIDARLRTRAALTAPEKALVDREIATLRERQTQLSVVGLVPGRLVTSALPAPSAATMSTKGLLVGGLAVGLLLGTLAALLRHRLDPRVGSASWIEETLGVPVRRAAGGSLDRHALLVLGLLRGGSQVPARLVCVSAPGVPVPSFADRVVEFAREQGIAVRYDVHVDADAPAGLHIVDPADGADATQARPALHVTRWQAQEGRPWPVPQALRSAMVAVELRPQDQRQDVADLVDSIRYLGCDVNVAVLRDDAPALAPGPAPAQEANRS
ncbi:MAG: hypothetical protein IPI32_09985 [Austwickia sp.]|nr:hypothetical protein [Austwickia sp.]